MKFDVNNKSDLLAAPAVTVLATLFTQQSIEVPDTTMHMCCHVLVDNAPFVATANQGSPLLNIMHTRLLVDP